MQDSIPTLERLQTRYAVPRFIFAGGLATLVSWLVRFPISLVAPFGVAVPIAYIVGMGVGFVLYRSWVFPGSGLTVRVQVVRFVVVNVFGLITVTAVAMVAVALLKFTGFSKPIIEAAAHLIGVGAGAIVNFIGHRTMTFVTK